MRSPAATAAPSTQAVLPSSKGGPIRIVGVQIWVKYREYVLEVLRACPETVTSRAAVTTTTTILSTSLAASLVGKEGVP